MARAATRTNDSRDLVVQPPRLPYPSEAAPAGIPKGQWKALVDAIFPSAKTVDGVMLAVEYCKSRNLDIMKRPVHVVPMWNSALNREVETVWPSIGEHRTTAQRTGQWAGNDECQFGPILHEAFKDEQERSKKAASGNGREKYKATAECPAFDFPEWAQITVYKIVQGHRVAFVGPKVRFKEIFSGQKGLRVPNDKWRSAPFQMLEKCAEAAALRRAFPEELGNEYTAEEMEGKSYRGDPIEAARADFEVEENGGDPRPTRASVKREKHPWVEKGVPKEIWDQIEALQPTIDSPQSTIPGLKRGKETYVDRYAPEWPTEALDELKLRFDTAIAKLGGQLPLGDQQGREEDDEQATD